ncbi:unnamed protein product, partial [Mesorhabditis spiculigera]
MQKLPHYLIRGQLGARLFSTTRLLGAVGKTRIDQQTVKEAPVRSIPGPDLLEKGTVHPEILRKYSSEELQVDDHFKLEPLLDIREMFEARLHYGHKVGTLNDNMKWALYGERLGVCVFDLELTKQYLLRALNFVAHVASRGGIILFVTTNRETMINVEQTATKLGEYAHCRRWQSGTLTNSAELVGTPIRLPDTIIFLSTITSLGDPHPAIKEAAKMAIPTVGVVDSNADPAYLTYLIPANDDTVQSVNYLLRLFNEAIVRGKSLRQKAKNRDF